MRQFQLLVFVLTLLVALLGAGAAPAQGWVDRFEELAGAVTDSESSQTNKPANEPASEPSGHQLPAARVAAGLKAALADGAAWAVSQLGQRGGFWEHPARRIPLPDWVDKASLILRGAGYSDEIEQLHLTMNRAAEQAIAEVGPIVRETIENMTVADAYRILSGGKHAATQYLRQHAGDELADRIRPIVADATAQSTAARRYQALVSQAKPLLKLVPVNMNLSLKSYVTQKATDALFALIAKQEAEIRANPLARGTDLLRAVFGGA